MPDRDPRTDPQLGDVLIYGPQWQRERCKVTGTSATKISHNAFLDMVWYRIGDSKADMNTSLRSWREWMDGAEVIRRGDEPKEGEILKPEIKAGQIWQDKDRRRSQDGTVRTFRVINVGVLSVQCQDKSGRNHWFKPERFGSGRANDSFELVGEPKQNG